MRPVEETAHLVTVGHVRRGAARVEAAAVAFLAGAARWINGQILYANGGLA
ncbi:hypothetical protein [Streptomyces sp. NPDC002588]|uniref:hypothetical protein n=1 Tax=Streptomyces sp. NPDC002588 TaxID=3154419 RepID=UPI00332758AA